jgi:hypothetical protein
MASPWRRWISSNGGGSIESIGPKCCNLGQGKPWSIFLGWAQSFGTIFVPCRPPCKVVAAIPVSLSFLAKLEEDSTSQKNIGE